MELNIQPNMKFMRIKYQENLKDLEKTVNENKKMYRTISEDMCIKNKNKFNKKEIDDITNKLHYDGDIIKKNNNKL